MLETKYYRDLKRNYLVIQCNEEYIHEKYQFKMITANKIPGLLQCSTRFMNGITYLYYEISSKQTVKNLFEYKKMEIEQIKTLFICIKKVLEELQSYLLEDYCLVLLPEYLFWNLESNEISFLYFPNYVEKEDNSIQMLLEYLVEVINHENQKLVDIIYYLCDLAQRGQFVIEEILYYFDENIEEVQIVKEEDYIDRIENSFFESEYNQIKEISTISENQDKNEVNHSQQQISSKEKSNKKLLVLSIFFLLGGSLLFYIRDQYILTPNENLLFLLVEVILFIIAIITIVFYILHRRKDFWHKSKSFIDDEINNNSQFAFYYPSLETENAKVEIENNIEGVKNSQEAQEYGDTIFLSHPMYSDEKKLYGISKGNKITIELSNLPCTIGKMQECVDLVIEDTSISRVHAKFIEREKIIYMTDLNSTNGTFKNGLQLDPNETVSIEKGDEVKFGKLIFCYR